MTLAQRSYSTSHNLHPLPNPKEPHVYVNAQFIDDDEAGLGLKHYTYFCPLRMDPQVGKWMRVHNGHNYCWVRLARVGTFHATKADRPLKTISSPGTESQQKIMNDTFKHLWEPKDMTEAKWHTPGTKAPHAQYYLAKGESGEHYFCDETYNPQKGKWIEIALGGTCGTRSYQYDRIVYVSPSYVSYCQTPLLVANQVRQSSFVFDSSACRTRSIEDVLTPVNYNEAPTEKDMNALKIENKVFINDADSKGFNDNDLIDKIQEAENEIVRLSNIKAQSKKIEARKADLQAGIEKLTALLDSR